MIMWDKVIMSKEDSVFDDTISNMYVLFNDDKSILYFFGFNRFIIVVRSLLFPSVINYNLLWDSSVIIYSLKFKKCMYLKNNRLYIYGLGNGCLLNTCIENPLIRSYEIIKKLIGKWGHSVHKP